MTKDEYEAAKNAWMKKEFDKDPQKPSGMIGTWGWYLKKEKEFNETLKNV